MATVNLDFSELTEFNANMLKMVERDLPNEAKKFMQRAGNELRKDMRISYQQNTRRKTGNLLRGLSRSRAYVYQGNEYQVRVKNTAPHAHLIEHGHDWVRKRGGTVIARKRNAAKAKHIAGTSVKNFGRKFSELADKFVDDLLKRGIG